MNMLNLALVLVAAFAAVHGKMDKKGRQVFERCRDEVGMSQDQLYEGWEIDDFWCQDEKTRLMAECVLTGFGAWSGNALSTAPAEKRFQENPKELEEVLKCYKFAESHQHQPCNLLDCVKKQKIGHTSMRKSKRSIFFV